MRQNSVWCWTANGQRSFYSSSLTPELIFAKNSLYLKKKKKCLSAWDLGDNCTQLELVVHEKLKWSCPVERLRQTVAARERKVIFFGNFWATNFWSIFFANFLSIFDVHVLANIGSCNFAMELSCSVTQTKSCPMKTKKNLKLWLIP